MLTLASLVGAALIALLLLGTACDDDDDSGNDDTGSNTPSASAPDVPNGSDHGNSDDEGTPTPTFELSDVPTTSPEDAASTAALTDSLLAAMAAGDTDLIFSMLIESERDRVSDRDLDQLAMCVPPEAELVKTETVIDGDKTRIKLDWEIPEEGSDRPEKEKLTIQLRRQEDGTWMLRELPRCPF